MKALLEILKLDLADVVTTSQGGSQSPCTGEVIELPTECGGDPEEE